MFDKAVFVAVIAFLVAGCSSLGPRTVNRDRFDYVVAISESWKRQTLLNMVKTRYVDVPVYMDIASVISQYAIEGEFGFELAPSFSDDNLLLGNAKYTDRPTITYSPLVGENYTRSILKPVPLSVPVLLIQADYPADEILRICVQAINGIHNQRSSYAARWDADPAFTELTTLVREIQAKRGMLVRGEMSENNYRLFLEFRPTADAALDGKIKRVMTILDLNPTAKEFELVYGNKPKSKNEIAVLSRALSQIMTEYASFIDVPQADVDEGRVMAVRSMSEEGSAEPLPLIRVRSGVSEPDDAYVAVAYRDMWFWIEDTDLRSKAALNFLMTLFALTERGSGANQAPVITVPTY